MRVSWLTYTNERDYDRVESTLWIRGYQLLPHLERAGIACSVNEHAFDPDVAVFLRWQDREAQRLAADLKRRGCRVVFDLCVNYFDEAGLFGGGYGAPRERIEEAAEMTRLADVITCASAQIAARASAHHARAVYIPDSVDRAHFRCVKNPDDFRRPRLRAAWSGVSVKATDLRVILPLLARHRMGLTIISEADPFPRFTPAWFRWKRRLDYHFIPWHYQTFPSALLEGDVCVSPREVTSLYNRGHSFFKIAVFMAQGVPAIASPVPSYRELLGDGRGGRLCDTTADWDRALGEAGGDRDALAQWSAHARRSAAAYDTERVANQYVQLFHELGRRAR